MNSPAALTTGLYVHVPFCRRKCLYCDFYSITDLSRRASYLRALAVEMGRVAEAASAPVDTLYIGGGTPSVLEAGSLERILATAGKTFPFLPRAEVTLEANPGTLDSDLLRAFKAGGGNRLNIGVQSFRDERLRFLGRVHSGQAAVQAIDAARAAGFDNIGLDLIYGLPGQTRADWLADLQRAVAFAPEHLACYLLTYEPGTPLERLRRAGRVQPLAESAAAELFDATCEYLASAGYRQYEISNFARTDAHRSRHNLKYWTGAPYVGLGPSAHSFSGTERRWNVRSVDQYVRSLAAGRLPVEGRERLDRSQQMIEALYLGLRMTAGIDLEAFDRRFGVDFRGEYRELLAEFGAEGYVAIAAGRCALTRRGMRFQDSITARFVCAGTGA